MIGPLKITHQYRSLTEFSQGGAVKASAFTGKGEGALITSQDCDYFFIPMAAEQLVTGGTRLKNKNVRVGEMRSQFRNMMDFVRHEGGMLTLTTYGHDVGILLRADKARPGSFIIFAASKRENARSLEKNSPANDQSVIVDLFTQACLAAGKSGSASVSINKNGRKYVMTIEPL